MIVFGKWSKPKTHFYNDTRAVSHKGSSFFAVNTPFQRGITVIVQNIVQMFLCIMTILLLKTTPYMADLVILYSLIATIRGKNSLLFQNVPL